MSNAGIAARTCRAVIGHQNSLRLLGLKRRGHMPAIHRIGPPGQAQNHQNENNYRDDYDVAFHEITHSRAVCLLSACCLLYGCPSLDGPREARVTKLLPSEAHGKSHGKSHGT